MPKRSAIDNVAEMQEARSFQGPPRKRMKAEYLTAERTAYSNRLESANSEDSRTNCEQTRESADEREDSCGREGVAPSVSASAPVLQPAPPVIQAPVPAPVLAPVQAPPKPSRGIILRSGRIRLPDKLIQYLNNGVTPALFWQPDGQGFSIDCDKIQAELLDKYFHGTKLSSFLRSLNRWGFKRLFYHSMPKSTLSFHHPLFRKDSPDLCNDMNMAPCTGGAAATATTEARKQAKPLPRAEVKIEPSQPLAPAPAAVSVPQAAYSAPVSAAAFPTPVPSSATPVAVQPNPAAFMSNLQQQSGQTASIGGLNTQNPSDLYNLLGQMREQVAAEAASKDLLLRQAMMVAQQQANQQQQNIATQQQQANQQNNQSNPLDLLEGMLSSLVGGQPQQQQQQQPLLPTSNSQLAALASALSAPPRAPAPTPPPPPAAAQPQQQQAANLLQMLTPAQLEALSQLANNGTL